MSSAPKEGFKSFVTEKEVEEKKKVRQAEWERVRKPDEPLQVPEEPIDNRTLYDRLKDQKLKEQEEKEEARKLKNFVRGLEHDEVEFLDQLDDIYVKMEREKQLEEKKALMEFRDKLAAVQTETPLGSGAGSSVVVAKRKESFGSGQHNADPPKKRQKDLLSGIVKIKRSDSANSETHVESVTQEGTSTKDLKQHSAKKNASIGLVAGYGSSSDSE